MTMAEVREIVDIALIVNGLSERKKDITGDLPTVFFEMYGNAAILRIRAHKKGWDGSYPNKVFEFSTDKPLDEKAFSNYKRYMAGLLENCPQKSEVGNE